MKIIVRVGPGTVNDWLCTDESDDLLLGEGFRGYLTTYSVARRHLDHAQLNFQTSTPT
jgi:hypothetical protein